MSGVDEKPPVALGLNISLDPNEINRFVSQKILDSGIGQVIEKTIKEKLSGWLYDGYDSPVKKIFYEVVAQQMRESLAKPENAAKINEAVAKVLTPDTIETIVRHGVQKLKDGYS